MVVNISKLVNGWAGHHKNFIQCISGAGIAAFAGAVVWATLPVIIAAQYGEWRAGVIISIIGFVEAFLIDPIGGNMADRIGSKKTVMIGLAAGSIGALLWTLYSLKNPFVLALVAFLLFIGYGFRDSAETYVLRITKKNEGGMAFGLLGNMSSLAIFLGTVTLPFFVMKGHEVYAAWVMIVVYMTSFLIFLRLPNDPGVRRLQRSSIWHGMNPIPAIRNGWNFVRINKNYPLLLVGATFFEGLFYGTIWFVFPLHLAKVGIGGESGLHLGVYDLVTALFAGYAGYLADRYNWRHTHSLGWLFVIVGLIALPFYGWPAWLVIIGFIIAIGNNLSYYAAAHALEANDIDHREDGEFVGLKSIVSSVGYAISPLIAGFLYSKYGFAVSLTVNSMICVVVAIGMVWLTWRLENAKENVEYNIVRKA